MLSEEIFNFLSDLKKNNVREWFDAHKNEFKTHEKEVKSFEERKLVAGILWKRLKGNVPLQVDATISYITGKKTTKISKEETQIDSPFNTYKYKGLPLGPICNPSLDSIIASLYPENSEYWYYLSAPDGKTIFSKTLEEHNIAKTKY